VIIKTRRGEIERTGEATPRATKKKEKRKKGEKRKKKGEGKGRDRKNRGAKKICRSVGLSTWGGGGKTIIGGGKSSP